MRKWCDSAMVRVENTGKRLIKSPKIYISDSGILTALLGLTDFIQLSGHPVMGSLWEGMVLANLKASFQGADIRFYRTNHGSEIDFLMILSKRLIAIEGKASKAPQLSKGTFTAIHDLKPHQTFIVSPVEKGYSARKDIDVVTLDELTDGIGQMIDGAMVRRCDGADGAMVRGSIYFVRGRKIPFIQTGLIIQI